MNWANAYIGKPWESGATGPGSYDCLGLVRDVQRTQYGRELPCVDVEIDSLIKIIRAIKNHDGWLSWVRVARPVDGCLVKLYRQTEPDHIGVWLDVDGGGVLHSSQKNGVQFDTPFCLKSMGWGRLEYYRYRGIDA